MILAVAHNKVSLDLPCAVLLRLKNEVVCNCVCNNYISAMYRRILKY